MNTKITRLETIAHMASIELMSDGFDEYGDAMNLWFAAALVLDASDIEGDKSPGPFERWQYVYSPYVAVPSIETIAARDNDSYHEGEFADDYNYHTVMLASAYQRGDITQDDLIYIGDCMALYCAILKDNDKDY